jgi:hypothetical protein
VNYEKRKEVSYTPRESASPGLSCRLLHSEFLRVQSTNTWGIRLISSRGEVFPMHSQKAVRLVFWSRAIAVSCVRSPVFTSRG